MLGINHSRRVLKIVLIMILVERCMTTLVLRWSFGVFAVTRDAFYVGFLGWLKVTKNRISIDSDLSL